MIRALLHKHTHDNGIQIRSSCLSLAKRPNASRRPEEEVCKQKSQDFTRVTFTFAQQERMHYTVDDTVRYVLIYIKDIYIYMCMYVCIQARTVLPEGALVYC